MSEGDGGSENNPFGLGAGSLGVKLETSGWTRRRRRGGGRYHENAAVAGRERIYYYYYTAVINHVKTWQLRHSATNRRFSVPGAQAADGGSELALTLLTGICRRRQRSTRGAARAAAAAAVITDFYTRHVMGEAERSRDGTKCVITSFDFGGINEHYRTGVNYRNGAYFSRRHPYLNPSK